jgi:hypothetical protein
MIDTMQPRKKIKQMKINYSVLSSLKNGDITLRILSIKNFNDHL